MMDEESIFLAALEISESDRLSWLQTACGGDAILLDRILGLLSSHSSSDPFLRRPILQQYRTSDSGGFEHLSPERSGSTSAADSSSTQASDHEFRRWLQSSEHPGSLGRLGNYEVLEVLGSGAFGTVVKALDERLHRFVAIKLLAAEQARSRRGRQRFLREARAAAAVRHENVVILYDVEETPVPHLVMEYVRGSTLQQKIQTRVPFTVADIFQTGIQIADGLAAAHRMGLVHRDIKPANILLEADTGRVRIADFGLARAVDDSSITQGNLIAGTPQFMSPEQAEGRALDSRSDLFSLGSVLYTLCAAQVPFSGTSTIAVLRQVCDREPVSVRERNPAIPEFLAAIVRRLHEKQPDLRFQSAETVASWLRQGLAEYESTGTISLLIPPGSNHEASSPDARRPARTVTSKRLATLIAPTIVVIGIVLAGILKWSSPLKPAGEPVEPGAGLFAVKVPAAIPSAADQLSQSAIQPAALAIAGQGDPSKAPKGLVAILGQPGFPHSPGANSHSGIMDLAISRDGQFLASASANCAFDTNEMTSWEFRIWDIASGLMVREIDNLPDAVRSVDFDPDGSRLAVACDDGTVKVIRIMDGLVLWDHHAHGNRARTVEWNHDGSRIVSGGELSAIVWDAETGESLTTFRDNTNAVLDAQFSQNGETVLSTDGGSTVLWRVADAGIVRRFPGGPSVIRSVSFCSSEAAIAVANQDGKIHILNSLDGSVLFELTGHTGAVVDIQELSDQQHLISAGLDGTVRMWNIGNGQEVRVVSQNDQNVTCVAAATDQSILVSGDTLSRISVWNLATGEPIADCHRGPVTAVEFGPGGNQLISGGADGTVRLWDLSTGQLRNRLTGRLENVRSVDISPDGQLAAASGSALICVWNLTSAQLQTTLEGHTDDIRQIRFVSDEKLVSVGEDHTLKLWDTKQGLLQNCSLGGPAHCLALSPDRRLVAVGVENAIQIRNTDTLSLTGILTEHSQRVRSVAFHPGGQWIVSSAEPGDSGVIVQEIHSGKEVRRLEGHIGGAQACFWRSDGRVIVTSGTSDGTIQFWDMTGVHPRRTVLARAANSPDAMTGLAMTPDGRHLATANANGTLYILRQEQGQEE